MKYRNWIALSLLFSCNAASANSNMESKIGQFFDKFNVVSNTSSSDHLNSQMGVHFLGGSGTVRSNSVDLNPIHVSMPKFSAGCGGIDYTLGAINVASKKEIIDSLKSIGSNSVGYAFLVGIEQVSPSIASTMKQVQTWANQLNGMSINSCELASSLVQGAWPKSQRASSYICEHSAAGSNLFSGLIEGKHGCRAEDEKKAQALEWAKDKSKDTLIGDYNVAWKVLSSSDLDDETKTVFMNLTGTIVVTEKGGSRLYPPHFTKALDLLRFGGRIARGYRISDDKIHIEEEEIVIQPSAAWKAKVEKILKSLQSKIYKEAEGSSVELTDEEKSLITTTKFPLGSFLSLMGQWNGGGAQMVSIEECADLIAFERVLSFAEDVITSILHRAEALRIAQIDSYQLDEYIKEIHRILKDLRNLETSNFRKISEKYQVIDYLLKIERNLKDKERGA